MEAYCPRCNKSVEQPEDAVARGECPTCGGQLSAKGVDTDGLSGAVGMTFDAGSNVGLPISPSHEQQPLEIPAEDGPGRPSAALPDLLASSDLPDPSAPPPGEEGGSPAATDEGARPAAGLAGSSGVDLAGFPAPPAFGAPAAAGDDTPVEVDRGAAADFGQQAAETEQPPAGAGREPDLGHETAAGEEAGGEPSSVDGEAAEPPAPESPSAPAGVHLQLPAIDFSMPDLGSIAPSAGGGSAPSGDLPAHLQLPSFPEFELPPIPGQEPRPPEPAPDAASPPAEGAAAPEGSPPAMQQPPAAPPPMPAPPPLKARPRRPPPQPAGGLDGLPEIPLPKITGPSAREPTLLGSDPGADIAIATRRSVVPVVLLVLVVLAAGGVGGAFLYFGPSTVVGWFSPQKAPVVQKTKRQRADELVIRANKAYREKKYKKAVGLLAEAVEIDPTHSEAHRTLGIAYAKTGQQAKAVEHYRRYLELSPDAGDAATVRRYVEDYDKAQATKVSAPESSRAPEKKDRRRRRRR